LQLLRHSTIKLVNTYVENLYSKEGLDLMNQILDMLLKNGLRPLSFLFESIELERKLNRSDLIALLMLYLRGEMTMSKLAEYLGIPLSTTTSLAKRLVHKGLINRNPSNEDKRIMLVQLTTEGEKIALHLNELIEDIITRVQSSLTAEELNQFISLVIKIGKTLQQKDDVKAVPQTNQSRIIKIDD
jgi:DNA-binding MarR family transcriptional regulator